MNTTDITKEQLNIFVVAGKSYLTNREKSELTEAIEMLLPEAIEKLKKVERQRNLFRISLAKKTGSKHLEVDKHGNYQFNEVDTAKIWAEMDRIDKQTVKMHCHIVEEYPADDITFDMKRGFQGIVIPKMNNAFAESEEEEESETEE